MRFYCRRKRTIALLGLLTMLQFLFASCATELETSDISQANTTEYTPPSQDDLTLDLDGLEALIALLEADDMDDDPCATCLVVAVATDTQVVPDAGVPTETEHVESRVTPTDTTRDESGSGSYTPPPPAPTEPGSATPEPTQQTEPTEQTINVIDAQCVAFTAPRVPKYGGTLREAWALFREIGEGFGKLAARWGTLGLKWSAIKLVDTVLAKISSRKWGANLNKLNDLVSKIARIKSWDTATKLDKMFSVYAKYAKRTKSTLKIAIVAAIAMAIAGKGFSWLWDQINPWGSGKELEKAKKDLNKRIDDLAAKVQPNNTLTEEQKMELVDDLLKKVQKEADEIKAMPNCTEAEKKARKDAFEAWKKKYAPYLELIKGIKADLENAEKAMKNAGEMMGELKKTLDAIAAAEGDLDKYLAAALDGIADDEDDGLDADALKKAKAELIAGAGLTPEEIASLGE
ncbi:MAG: hypothetical protein ACKV2T_15955 [Kofleriaceae bacterium]